MMDRMSPCKWPMDSRILLPPPVLKLSVSVFLSLNIFQSLVPTLQSPLKKAQTVASRGKPSGATDIEPMLESTCQPSLKTCSNALKGR